MKTWHYRLQEAMTARGKDWQDLFAHLNATTDIKKPSVYAWKVTAEKQSTMINGDNAAVVCEWLGINPMWLFFGKGQSGLDGDQSETILLESFRKLPKEDRARIVYTVTSDAAYYEMKSKQLPESEKKSG